MKYLNILILVLFVFSALVGATTISSQQQQQHQVKISSSSSSPSNPTIPPSSSGSVNNTILELDCTICSVLCTEVAYSLFMNTSISSISQFYPILNNFCKTTFAPLNYDIQACLSMVKEYTVTMVNMVANADTCEYICGTTFLLCDSSSSGSNSESENSNNSNSNSNN